MRTLTTSNLEPGMIAAEPVVTPLGQLLAPAGTEFTRQLINRMKLYKVKSAIVLGEDPRDTEVEAAPKPAAHVKTHAEQSKTHSQKVAASDEFRNFQMQYFDAIDYLRNVFTSATTAHYTIDVDALVDSVSNLFRSRNTIVELFDMLFNMRIISDSVYSHCLNVGLISRMIGRWLKLNKHDLNILTAAGLLHDIGKIKIPDEVLNKPGKLTDEEFLKSGPNGVVEDDSKSENNEKIKFELKLIYSDGKEEEIDLGIIKNESEFESLYYTVGARYVSDKNFYIAHAFNMAYELQPIPEMLAIVSKSEEFSKYEGIYIHEY